ncbi:MAG: YbaB/EbfC family nucleoid-associated protein [Robiginitomaculum sp.]|nr:MAG: YbaB/EbfC family nucleoid-associated protein [Robiginitomaculum sp.]
MKDIMGLMKQAKTMQEKMEHAKAQVADLVAEGNSGGGLVRLTISGEGHMQSLKIDPVLVDKDEIEILEDLVIAAFHDAKVKMDQKQQETMKSAMGDLQLPPGLDMPF